MSTTWRWLGGLFVLCLVSFPAMAAPPAANIDQIRNGAFDAPWDPGEWVNGNAGQENAHYAEGWSIPYRVRLTDIPTGVEIRIVLGYDITHSSKHALDYLTYFDRLDEPPGSHQATFEHDPEEIDPLDDLGFATPAGMDQFPIPCPTTCVTVTCTDPDGSQPCDSCSALAEADRMMTMYGGDITGVAFVTQGDLAASQSEAQIAVTFIASSTNAVLAWGGHIASRADWGCPDDPQSAGGISGSPYHMRLKEWAYTDPTPDPELPSLPNLGNQDRSLKAAAVFVPAPTCEVTDTEDTICEGSTAGSCVIAAGGVPPLTAEWLNPAGVVIETCTGLADGGQCCFEILNALPSDSGPYTARVTDSRGLQSTQTCQYVLTVVPQSTAAAGPDDSQCASTTGETCFTLAGSGSDETSASWAIVNRSTTPADCLISISPATGSFTPQVCFAQGCTGWVELELTVPGQTPCPDATDRVVLTVYPNPIATIADVCDILPDGSGGDLCVTVTSGTPPYLVDWKDAGGTVVASCVIADDGGNCCLTDPAVGTYTAEITDSSPDACTTSATGEVFENPTCDIVPPITVTGPGQASISGTISGGTAPYTCTATVDAASGWTVGCQITDSTFEVSITLDPTTADNTAEITVTITDDNGCTTTCSETIAFAQECSVSPPVQSVCQNGAAGQFCAEVTAGSPGSTNTVQWFGPFGPYPIGQAPPACDDAATLLASGKLIASATCTGLAVGDTCCLDVVTDTPGVWTYCALVTDGLGFPAPSACQGILIVNPNPTCSVTDVCLGEGDLCATVSGGTAPYTVVWKDSAGVVVGGCADVAEGGQCCLTPTAAGVYTAFITDSAVDASGQPLLCETTCSGTVWPNPTCSIVDPEVCVGEDLCVTAQGGTAPYSVVWKDSTGAVVGGCTDLSEGGVCCITTTAAGIYTAEVDDVHGCGPTICTGAATFCNEGCTPGYWKTHPNRWDGGCNGASSADDFTTTIKTCSLFNATLGVTPAQSGLANTVTLLRAANLTSGGLMALNRHTAAALASADSGIAYPYSVAGVIALYQDAVGAVAGPETIQSALAKLSAANESNCPLN